MVGELMVIGHKKSLPRASARVLKIALCAATVITVLSGTSAIAGNTTYQYDTLGRVVKVTYPDAKQVCYDYDSAGNRIQVKRQATGTCSAPASTALSAMVVDASELATAPTTDDAVSTASYTAPTTEELQAAQSSSAPEN